MLVHFPCGEPQPTPVAAKGHSGRIIRRSISATSGVSRNYCAVAIFTEGSCYVAAIGDLMVKFRVWQNQVRNFVPPFPLKVEIKLKNGKFQLFGVYQIFWWGGEIFYVKLLSKQKFPANLILTLIITEHSTSKNTYIKNTVTVQITNFE